MRYRHRSQAPQSTQLVEPRRHLGHRPQHTRQARLSRSELAYRTCRQTRGLGAHPLPSARHSHVAGAKRTPLHRHFRDFATADHLHQPQLRQHGWRPQQSARIGSSLCRKLRQYSARSRFCGKASHCVHSQQQLPRRPEAARGIRHHPA